MQLFTRIIAAMAGVVFIVTGAIKLMGTDTFSNAVAEHGLVPAGLVGAFSLAFPLMEITLGAAAIVLAAINRTGPALWIGAALFAALCLYSLGVAFRPPEGPVPCGCGFGTMVDNWWALAMRNFVLCAALVAMAFWGGLAAAAQTQDEK